VRGKGTVDLAQEDGRPRLTADITSKSLNLADLGVAFGAGVEQPGEQKGTWSEVYPNVTQDDGQLAHDISRSAVLIPSDR